jgi:uncharacterized protein
MKRIALCALVVCLLLSATVLPAAARTIPDARLLPRFVDDASLLALEDAATLLDQLDAISERHQFDLAIATVPSLGGQSPYDFADDFFDYNGYGMGATADGMLLVISMEERDWVISTHGFGIDAFTDAGQAHIMDEVLPHLSDGDYMGAFTRFAQLSDDFLVRAREGAPYDTGNLPKRALTGNQHLIVVGASLALALIGAFLALQIMKSSHKSVRAGVHADAYVRKGSFRLTASRDLFLYKQVSRRRRETESKGGGSSTRTSSSGRSHGGSSGKF